MVHRQRDIVFKESIRGEVGVEYSRVRSIMGPGERWKVLRLSAMDICMSVVRGRIVGSERCPVWLRPGCSVGQCDDDGYESVDW